MSLRAEGVTVRRGGRTVLHAVHCSVEPGTVLAILGPNGAGKSTLFATLAGDLRPDNGRVLLGGRALDALGILERARRRAVLRQQATMAFDYPVREVVDMGLHARRLDGKGPVGGAIVSAVTAATGTGAFLDRSIGSLSGGEAQRVHLARVLAQVWPAPGEADPRYLLLDEPTASLDLRHQHGLMETVRGVAAAGLGIAVALHDPALAARYADRVLMLKDGRALTPEPAVAAALDAATLAGLYEVPSAVIHLPRRLAAEVASA